jgi:hypothetical protein
VEVEKQVVAEEEMEVLVVVTLIQILQMQVRQVLLLIQFKVKQVDIMRVVILIKLVPVVVEF